MSNNLIEAFTSICFRRNDWKFVDLRINIPRDSFGSDAINPHTQYSNPVAVLNGSHYAGFGASFTLGEGNRMLCEAADFMVRQLEGRTVADIIESSNGFYEELTNPLQLRWLSPNSGVPLMAAGVIVNTLIDAASKSCGLPAWEFLARLPSDFLLRLMSSRHLSKRHDWNSIKSILDKGLEGIDERCIKLQQSGLPVYFTTWIGHDAKAIADQIHSQYTDRCIKIFKLKIGKVLEHDLKKIQAIRDSIPKDVVLCADANQTLSLNEALEWTAKLSELGFLWLEEPFAPDNTQLFEELIMAKKNHNWTCEIVTGENCPNHFTASALMKAGIDRFQADPCRMLGLIDAMLTCAIAKLEGCTITPHAGGSSLDEQSPHIQLFNLARICTEQDPSASLTENVGFCSKYFAAPSIVINGRAVTPQAPGLLVGLAPKVQSNLLSYKDGITWLAL